MTATAIAAIAGHNAMFRNNYSMHSSLQNPWIPRNREDEHVEQ